MEKVPMTEGSYQKLDEEINEREMRDIRKKEKLLDLAEKERQQKLVKDESDKALIENSNFEATTPQVLNMLNGFVEQKIIEKCISIAPIFIIFRPF